MSGPQDGDVRVVLVRALKALAQAPGNRVLILDAGGLELLLDALSSPDPLLWKVHCFRSTLFLPHRPPLLLLSWPLPICFA